MKILVIGSGVIGKATHQKLLSFGISSEVALISSRLLEAQSDLQTLNLIRETNLIIWTARDAGAPRELGNSSPLWDRLQRILTQIHWRGKFVFASSAGAIYGNDTEFPSSETSRQFPVEPYGRIKKLHEMDLIENARTGEFEILIARVTNVFTVDKNDRGIIGSVLRSIENRENFVLQWGFQTRDFICLEDLTTILVQLISLKQQGIFNIGSGVSLNMFDVIGKFEHFYQKKSNYVLDGSIPLIPRSEVVISKLLKTGIPQPRTIDMCLLEMKL